MNANPLLNLSAKERIRLAQEVVACFSTQELDRFFAEYGQDALEVLELNDSFLGIMAGKPLND